ncbi:MAG: aminotransferase [Pseudomonadota bacterium]
MNQAESEALWRMDRDHFIHPYTDYSIFKEEGSQIFSAADGVYVTDAQGRRMLDGIGGLWCVNIGHGREEMAEAIADQVMSMQYYNPFGHSTNEPAARLAAKLAELAPGDLNHVFYSCGGSTANDAAIRLVHYYNNLRGQPNKKKIISRLDAYHGATYVAANLTGIHASKQSFDRIADDWIQHVSAANLYRRPAGAELLDEDGYTAFLANELENRILQLGPDTVAAFIAEPIMGAGGVLVAPRGYHARMQAVCRAYDVLYIADEVVTGFGRLGHWFASEAVFDCQPDIIVSAKGISSGYIPLGATLLSSRIHDVISKPQCEGGVLSMGFTYSGHPVACAAALKNIEIMEREDICGHVRENGPYFRDSLGALADLPIVGDVRGSHYMVGIEYVQDKEARTPFDGAQDIAGRVFRHCRDRGLIVRPVGPHLSVLSPPLVFSRRNTDDTVAILRASIDAVTAELD